MATELSANDGYSKYLRGRDHDLTVKTSTKLAAKEPQLKDDNGKTVKLRPGEKVHFSPNYKGNNAPNVQYGVKYKGRMYTIHTSYLMKPGREALPDFKPQQLGIKNKYPAKQFGKIISDMFAGMEKQRGRIGPETFEYVQLLCDYVLGSQAQSNKARQIITKNWPAWKTVLPLKDIAKDLAEIIGPLWYANSKKNKYDAVEIEYPTAGNEPLVDYYITFQDEKGNLIKRPCSAKSAFASSANTAKLNTVLKAISSLPPQRKTAFTKQWKGGWIWNLMDYNTELLKTSKTVAVNSELREWAIKNKVKGANKTLDKGAFWGAISRDKDNAIDLKSFFSGFANKTVWYIVFDIGHDGLPIFIANLEFLDIVAVKLKEMNEQLGFDLTFRTQKMKTKGV